MAKLLLTVHEVCEVTGFGETTIRGLIRREELSSILVGRARRIPAEALHDWISTRVVEVEA